MPVSKGATLTNIIGFLVLLFFAVSVIYLARHIAETELQWGRLVYVFGGVEAIAFAATGYFFGKEVNRERADKAEVKATAAGNEAKTDHGAKSVAETKLSALIKYIDTNTPGGGSSVLDELGNWSAKQPSISKHELMNFIEKEKKRQFVAPFAPDPNWDALARFAKSL